MQLHGLMPCVLCIPCKSIEQVAVQLLWPWTRAAHCTCSLCADGCWADPGNKSDALTSHRPRQTPKEEAYLIPLLLNTVGSRAAVSDINMPTQPGTPEGKRRTNQQPTVVQPDSGPWAPPELCTNWRPCSTCAVHKHDTQVLRAWQQRSKGKGNTLFNNGAQGQHTGANLQDAGPASPALTAIASVTSGDSPAAC